MSIKIGGTEIINNFQEFLNITGMEGNYGDFQPLSFTTPGGGVGTINFDRTFNKCTLTAATTFANANMTNRAAGKMHTLILDISANGSAPTFDTDVKWANDTTPSFTGARYWQIVFTCWDSSVIRAVATSWGA